ncbi:FHA domain-containing protein [Kitasatospora sp. NPDC048365]|uniref:FHA domain-containing protein n=1 Tax=Kitasatospora sp. NPDC048365 TaxID=3364050 RepID=UPI00372207F2
MPICPRGHESQAEDWCDFCGFPMTPPPGLHVPGTPPPPPAPPGPPPTAPSLSVPDLTAGLVTCPICRTPQTGRYCEECGYDYALAPSPPPSVQPHPPTPVPPAPQPGPMQQHQPHQQSPHQQQAPQQHQPPQSPYGFEKPGFEPGPPTGAPAPSAPSHGGYPGTGGFPSPGGFPETGGFPDGDGYERTGPVYAQPGEEFGTSFRLAPPGAQTPAPPAPPAPPVRTNWIAVVTADRDYFTEMMSRSGPEAAALFFPPYCPERRIPLTGRGELQIGRRSQNRGTVPDIDLSVPPEDPGASHEHAVLVEQGDGSWVLVDRGSTNGTCLNGSPDSVRPHTAIPLNDGDRIHVGAWTTITLHRA